MFRDGIDRNGQSGRPLRAHRSRRLNGCHTAIGGFVAARAGAYIDHGSGVCEGPSDHCDNASVRLTVSSVSFADVSVIRVTGAAVIMSRSQRAAASRARRCYSARRDRCEERPGRLLAMRHVLDFRQKDSVAILLGRREPSWAFCLHDCLLMLTARLRLALMPSIGLTKEPFMHFSKRDPPKPGFGKISCIDREIFPICSEVRCRYAAALSRE
jgi:hypothetical protein